MTAAAVDWNCLPHNAAKFFGLRSGFDRRDLKRAYGKLIRKFKPETHPNEFQRVRRAYEELENQLRYGVKQKAVATHTEAWTAIVASQANQQRKSSPTVDAVPSPTELAIKNPRETYKRLQDSPDKSPQDYFVLAVLSDLVPAKETNRFFRWLLMGLKHFPVDPGLQQLMRAFLSTDVELKQASGLLLACSKSLRSDVFYRLTESLWGRVVRDAAFAAFSKLLTTCEQNLKHKDSRARTTFYLFILKRAMWKANPKWTQQVMGFLESNGTQLDYEAEYELEFLSLAVDYIREDQARVRTSRLHEQLDDMLRSYCVDDWPTAVAKVAQVQYELARNAHGMIDAFPVSQGEDIHRLVSLCMMVVSNVSQQTGVDFGTATERQAESQAFAALSDLRDGILPVVRKIQWLRIRMYAVSFVSLVLLPPFILFAGLSTGLLIVILCLMWFVVGCMAYFMWLKPKILDRRVDDKTERLLTREYQNRWRSRLFRYVQSCGQAPQEALQNLQKAAHETGDGNWMSAVLSHIRGDAGLIMFGQAQMFVR